MSPSQEGKGAGRDWGLSSCGASYGTPYSSFFLSSSSSPPFAAKISRISTQGVLFSMVCQLFTNYNWTMAMTSFKIAFALPSWQRSWGRWLLSVLSG
jgi:hypothetical protein